MQEQIEGLHVSPDLMRVGAEIEAFVHGPTPTPDGGPVVAARAAAEQWAELAKTVHARAQTVPSDSAEHMLLRTWAPLFEAAQLTAERRVQESAPDDAAAWTALGVAAAALLAILAFVGLAAVADAGRRSIFGTVAAESIRFRRALPELLRGPHASKWVVFSSGEVKSAHDSAADAVRDAVATWGPQGGYVIAQVVPVERDHLSAARFSHS